MELPLKDVAGKEHTMSPEQRRLGPDFLAWLEPLVTRPPIESYPHIPL